MNDPYLEPYQSREGELSPYERKLAGLVQEVFASGAYELDRLVQALNERGSLSPAGEPWTEESFRTEMARLGG
jgi:hypothetical protein